jgi:hypothetical protein
MTGEYNVFGRARAREETVAISMDTLRLLLRAIRKKKGSKSKGKLSGEASRDG